MPDLIELLLLGHHSLNLHSLKLSGRNLSENLGRLVDEQRRTIEELGRGSETIISAVRKAAMTNAAVSALGTARLASEIQDQTDTLREPIRTRARERQRNGYNALEKGRQTGEERWFADAIEEFEAAISEDRYDYMSYWCLGEIHTFHKLDSERAQQAYRDASHYAWPEDARTTALALLGLAWWRGALGDSQGSLENCREAVQKAPDLGIARLRLASAIAENGGTREEVSEHARRAVDLEWSVLEAVVADPHIGAYSELVDQLTGLALESATAASEHLARFDDVISAAQRDIRSFALTKLKFERFGDRSFFEDGVFEWAQAVARQVDSGEAHALAEDLKARARTASYGLLRDLGAETDRLIGIISRSVLYLLQYRIGKNGAPIRGEGSPLPKPWYSWFDEKGLILGFELALVKSGDEIFDGSVAAHLAPKKPSPIRAGIVLILAALGFGFLALVAGTILAILPFLTRDHAGIFAVGTFAYVGLSVYLSYRSVRQRWTGYQSSIVAAAASVNDLESSAGRWRTSSALT